MRNIHGGSKENQEYYMMGEGGEITKDLLWDSANVYYKEREDSNQRYCKGWHVLVEFILAYRADNGSITKRISSP